MAQRGRFSGTGAMCLLLGAGLVLSACDARDWPMGGRFGATRDSSTQKSKSTQSAAAQKPAPRQDTEAVASVSPSSVPKISEPVAGVTLVGLDSTQVQKMLGPPAEESDRATPAKSWRYRYAQCTLDMTLYPDVQTQVFRVLSYEVNGNDGTEQGKRQCNAGLRSRVGAK
jgi:hypothetical protein